MSLVLAVDIGGTTLKGALVDGTKIFRERSVKSEKTHVSFLSGLNRLIHELKKGKKVKAIGIGSPGAIDVKNGVVINSPNTPQKDFPLRDFLKKHHKLPVYVDNDANAFVLAEAVYGAGSKYGIVAGFTLGTGVGGGLVIHRRIFHGRNSAAEFGHIKIDYNGWEGPHGIRGGLEEYASARGVMRLAKKVTVDSPEQLSRLAGQGSKDAQGVWEQYGKYLGIGISNVIYAVDPDVVVIGGQIAKAWRYFGRAARQSAQENTFFPIPPIVPASATNSGILGAALLCERKSDF